MSGNTDKAKVYKAMNKNHFQFLSLELKDDMFKLALMKTAKEFLLSDLVTR
jgi:hypothetical protein